MTKAPPPQTEPKNAPEGVSRPCKPSGVDKPTIAQTEQKIEEQIRRVFRGRTHKSVRKLEVITEKDQLKHKTIVAPYEPTVEKLAVLFTKLLTASNRELLDRLEAEMDKCPDCPKDESPTIHLLKERAALDS